MNLDWFYRVAIWVESRAIALLIGLACTAMGAHTRGTIWGILAGWCVASLSIDLLAQGRARTGR